MREAGKQKLDLDQMRIKTTNSECKLAIANRVSSFTNKPVSFLELVGGCINY